MIATSHICPESLRCVKEIFFIHFLHNEYEQSSCLDDNLFPSVWLFYTFGNKTHIAER